MTILEAAVSLGSVVGSLLSSHVLRLVGNVYLILIAAALNVVAYVFTNVCLRESLAGATQVILFFHKMPKTAKRG